MYKLKVPIRDKCPTCTGKSCLPAEQVLDNHGKPSTRYVTCTTCNHTASVTRWIELAEFAQLLQQATCSHEHTSHSGGFHLAGGEVWDNLEEVCDDCGFNLDRNR